MHGNLRGALRCASLTLVLLLILSDGAGLATDARAIGNEPVLVARRDGKKKSARSSTAAKNKSAKNKSSKGKRARKQKSGIRAQSHRRSGQKTAHHNKEPRLPEELGILVEDEDGAVITEQSADHAFNPASAVKLITAYAALKKFGPNHRFVTEIRTEGLVDKGVLEGDLYIDGFDPDLDSRDVAALVADLKQQGIKKIKGDLVVSPEFSVYSNPNPETSARHFEKAMRRRSLKLSGSVRIGSAPPSTRLIMASYSENLKQTLKVMLSRSINSVADQIGRVTGGVCELEQRLVEEVGISPHEIDLATASGLGKGRVTPRAMIKVVRALREELRRHQMDLEHVMPVAGVDNGTLERRFTDKLHRGSVIAKTGTLPGTDGGVSALVGVMRSRQGEFYFVIFAWHGGVHKFKKNEDALIKRFQEQRGGPVAYGCSELKEPA